MPVRRPPSSRLTVAEQARLDADVYADLFARFVRWNRRAMRARRAGVAEIPPPPCLTTAAFVRHLPGPYRGAAAVNEVNLAKQRLKGRGLLREVSMAWGPRPADSCLVPVRTRRGRGTPRRN